MVTLSEQLSGLNVFDSLILIKDKIIDGINIIIFGFSSEHPVVAVFLISILLGIGIARWKKLKWWEGVIIVILIFFSLRFVGVGR